LARKWGQEDTQLAPVTTTGAAEAIMLWVGPNVVKKSNFLPLERKLEMNLESQV
jgi:hypothetical protein